MDHIKIWTEYAQKKLNDPSWYPWNFRRVVGGILMTGARCPLKKDGSPNYRLKDKTTQTEIIFPIED